MLKLWMSVNRKCRHQNIVISLTAMSLFVIAHYKKTAVCFLLSRYFKAIKSANQSGPIEVVVIDQTLQETYAFHIDPDGITAVPHSQCKDCQCVRAWNVEVDYLRRIVKNPAFYIKNPARLNWEWTHDS